MCLLGKPSSLRPLCHVCQPLIILVNWTCSSLSASSLHQGAQNWTQCSRCGLACRLKDSLSLTCCSWSCFTTRAYCRPTFLFISCLFLQHCSRNASLFYSTEIFQPRYQNFHLSMMNCMKFLSIHFSSLTKSF